MPNHKDRRTRISSILKDYHNQGIHRTGSESDNANSIWFAEKIENLGLKPIKHEFMVNKININQAKLEIKNKHINGIPVYDSVKQNSYQISGEFGSFTSNAEIGFDHIRTDRRLKYERNKNRHEVLVFSKKNFLDGIRPINAERFKKPFHPPVLHVSNEYGPMLKNLSKKREKAKVILEINRSKQKASNISTKINGTNKNLPPIIIMTPKSGWWQCVSERGGGIASFLEIMRHLKSNPPKRDFIFLATTGHELGHLGLKDFLKKNKLLIDNAFFWIQLGANFGAARIEERGLKKDPLIKVEVSREKISKIVLNLFKEVENKYNLRIKYGVRPPTEAKRIHDEGNDYFTIHGVNYLFHHPQDIWPNAVNIYKIIDITEALIGFISKIQDIKEID